MGLTNPNTVVGKIADKSRSNVVAPQLDFVRCETSVLPVITTSPNEEGEQSFLQGGPDAQHTTRRTFFFADPETKAYQFAVHSEA